MWHGKTPANGQDKNILVNFVKLGQQGTKDKILKKKRNRKEDGKCAQD